MINFHDYANENKTEHNLKWPYIRDHPYRILKIGGSHCTKTIFPKSLEYYEKFKNTKKISTFYQFFRFKTRFFPISKNMVFHTEENIILHQLFESKEDRISHLREIQNKNFPIV